MEFGGEPILSLEQRQALKGALPSVETPPEPEDTPSDPGTSLAVAARFLAAMDDMPDLNQTQRKIAYYLSKGLGTGDIASLVGCTGAYVRMMRQDPRVRKQMEIFAGNDIIEFAEEVSAQAVLDRAAVRAAEILAEKMNNALDEGVQLRAAIETLNRTGHATTKEQTITHVIIEQDVIKMYREAREEAGLVQDAEIVED